MREWPDKMIGIITVAVLLGTVAGLSVEDTHIKTDRNAFRSTICTYYSGNYTDADIAASQARIKQQTYMSDAQIEAVLFGRDFTQIPTQTLLQAAPHAAALVIACILWLPLCCCCVWPEKHPSCRKCRKPQKEMYGRCQLKWPAYCTVLAYLLVLGGGIIGIIQGPDIVYYFNDVGCKTSALADDLLNGRISPSVDGRFFVGIAPLKADLTIFQNAYNTIWTQNQNSLAIAGDVVTKQNFFQTSVNGTYTAYSDITYNTAFASNNGTTYVGVNSIFKDSFYGPISNANSLLGNIYAKTNIIFKQINAVLDPMKAAWTNLSATGQASVNSQMTASLTAFDSLASRINQFLGEVGPLFNKSGVFDQAILGMKAFYGACFALALLGTLSAIILACCSVVKIRYILYFTCAILFFLTLIALAILILLGIAAPTLAQTCGYMDTQLATGAATKQMLSRLGVSSVGDLLSNCMNDGTGWAMRQLSPTFNTTFSDQLLITRNAQLLNLLIPDYSTANLSAPLTTATTSVNKIRKAQILDVNDTVATDFIVGVLNVFFPIDPVCNSVRVNGDSWMPSSALSAISALYACPGGKASNSPCLNLDIMTTCPAGCYEIMQQMESSSGDASFATTLSNRYGGNVNCNYYKFILNLENNWNVPRSAKMATVLTSLTSLGSAISDYDNTFKSTQANVTTYATILQTNFPGTTDLVKGSFNGLDCRVIGESLFDLRNSICVGLLNSINYNFICLLLLAYGSLLVACCATCAGVRHFKHLQRMQIREYKGVPVSISEKRLFDQ